MLKLPPGQLEVLGDGVGITVGIGAGGVGLGVGVPSVVEPIGPNLMSDGDGDVGVAIDGVRRVFNHLAILGVEFLHLHKFAMVTAIIRDELCCDLDWLGAVDLEVANACNVRRSPALSISTAGLNLFLGHAACFTSKDLKEDEAPTSRAHGEASPGVDDHGLNLSLIYPKRSINMI